MGTACKTPFHNSRIDIAPSPLKLCHMRISIHLQLRKKWHEKEASNILSSLKDMQSQRTIPSFFIGLIHLGLGQHDKALDYLEASVNEHAHWWLFFKVDSLCSIRCGAHTASSICWTE